MGDSVAPQELWLSALLSRMDGQQSTQKFFSFFISLLSPSTHRPVSPPLLFRVSALNGFPLIYDIFFPVTGSAPKQRVRQLSLTGCL